MPYNQHTIHQYTNNQYIIQSSCCGRRRARRRLLRHGRCFSRSLSHSRSRRQTRRQRRWHSTLRHSGHRPSFGASRFTLPSCSSPVWPNVLLLAVLEIGCFAPAQGCHSRRLWAARYFAGDTPRSPPATTPKPSASKIADQASFGPPGSRSSRRSRRRWLQPRCIKRHSKS